MECKIGLEKIIDFHFGGLSLDERSAVESHLLSCPECLQEFFLLKRDLELVHSQDLAPSKFCKSRIDQDFARHFSLKSSNTGINHLSHYPKKFLVGGFGAVALIILLIVANLNPLSSELLDSTEPSSSKTAATGLKTLEQAVDRAVTNPSHINIL